VKRRASKKDFQVNRPPQAPPLPLQFRGIGTPLWQLARRNYRRLEDPRIGHLAEEW
jgi:hypothetical protein